MRGIRNQASIAAAPARRRSSTVTFLFAPRTPFVGREHERDAIRAAVDRARRGQGSLVLLAGGPGVGKSRLAMEMADRASRHGFRVLVGHCYERDEPFPFLPFAEILESGLAQAASLDDYRRSMGDAAGELAQIAPRIRRVFPDLAGAARSAAAAAAPPPLPELLGRARACGAGAAPAVRPRGPPLGRRVDVGAARPSGAGLAQIPVVIVGTFRPELDDGTRRLAGRSKS